MRSTGALWILLASLLWATTGAAATLAPGVSPLAIGAAAMGLGGLLQAGVVVRPLWRSRARLAARWRSVVLSALAVAVYPLAFYSSMRLAGVAVGSVVSIGSAPVAAALIERIVDRQALSRRWFGATALGVVGVVLLTFTHDAGTAAAPTLGVLLGLVAGVTYALYSWGAARVMRTGLPSRTVMGAVFGLGGALLMPVLVLTGGPLLATAGSVATVAYLAIVPMFVGYLLVGRGLDTVRASTATSISLVEPAAATLLAVVLLGETLPAAGWVGIALIFAGLMVTVLSPRPAGQDSRTTALRGPELPVLSP